jgi:hydroxyacylglutathione hydrolase
LLGGIVLITALASTRHGTVCKFRPRRRQAPFLPQIPYDPNTRILLTGDTFYPGKLTVDKWPAYRQGASRLAQFAAAHPVFFVLGAHIEMKQTPRLMYPIGTTFQPDEHILPLVSQHINSWRIACEAMGDHPHYDIHDEFIIEPP